MDAVVCGWVRSARAQKNLTFIDLVDGSTMAGIQVVLQENFPLPVGTAIVAEGTIVESPAKGQEFEMQGKTVHVVGDCSGEEYPLQKKRHSFEFLRTIAHLRPRTNTQGAVARIRSRLAYQTHAFFQERDFHYIQTPIITTTDCEGAGELFSVNTPGDEEFFGRPTYLTPSGQLSAETYACALSNVYTFGPTFRAENSHTARHISEFWMVEPEIAFAGLEEDMQLAEAYVKHLLTDILNHCAKDLAFFDKFVCKGLIERLEHVAKAPFARITYTEAIEVLQKCGKKFEYPVEWGADLQTEHERYLAEEHCNTPVFVTDYPKEIKAFYMRENDDGKTVAAVDLLVPGVGELIGGSQREERLDRLEEKIAVHGLSKEDYAWYLDLRRYGSVPHAGFGLGFERLVLYVTGMENIRDVSAFPRSPGNAQY